MPGECILETLQKIATAVHRLARLEASRDADRAQMQADLSRFKAEMERAELRLTRLLQSRAEQPPLLEQGDQEI
jgi:hypothetical protein